MELKTAEARGFEPLKGYEPLLLFKSSAINQPLPRFQKYYNLQYISLYPELIYDKMSSMLCSLPSVSLKVVGSSSYL